MKVSFSALLVNCVLVSFFFSGCTKFEKTGQIPLPGIAITFDDARVDNWCQYLSFLDSFHVKATFYISNYNQFTIGQKQKLALIQSHGHEIAFHSTNHYNMPDYISKGKHTLDELVNNEVLEGLKLMNRDGFYPQTFAYPYGAHSLIIDAKLRSYFKSIRALNGTTNFAKSLVPTENNYLIYGLGIDKSSKRTDEVVMQLIKSAADNMNCAVFVAHDINTADKFSVTLERLTKIFTYVNQMGMKFYTVSEISN